MSSEVTQLRAANADLGDQLKVALSSNFRRLGETVRYRAALEQIAGYGCRCDAGWGEFDDAQCPSCVARAALEEK